MRNLLTSIFSSMVQILTQMQSLMQSPECQPTSADKCFVLPQHHFDGTSPSSVRNHWAAFENI